MFFYALIKNLIAFHRRKLIPWSNLQCRILLFRI